MGGWVGIYYFLLIMFLLIQNWGFFFWGATPFLFDLTNQKDNLMVNERNHQSSWMRSNQLV
jgi:hypothetical protein